MHRLSDGTMSPSRITSEFLDDHIASMADRLSAQCNELADYFSPPSIDPSPPSSLNWHPWKPKKPDPDFEAFRARFNDTTMELLDAVNGPQMTLRTLCFLHYDLAAMQLALDRGFFRHIPLPETDAQGATWSTTDFPTASVADIAAKVNLDEDRTVRALRLLATQRIFEEVSTSFGTDTQNRADSSSYSSVLFRHTPISAFLARDEEFHAMADMQMDHMFSVAADMSTIARRFPKASDMEHPALDYKFGMPCYQFLEQNPAHATRFAKAMRSLSKMDLQIQHLRDSFDWESLEDGIVVDVGGGSGHICIALSQYFPQLRFIVQDISPKFLSHTTTTTETSSSSPDQQGQDLEAEPQITFQRHDFFQPQPVRDASAYLLRQVLHNYADADASRIIAAMVPALEEAGQRVPLLISDIVLPDKNYDDGTTTTRFEERRVRQMDFCMMLSFGSRQRSKKDWETLIKGVDPRLLIVKVHRNSFGAGLIEVRLVKNKAKALHGII